MVEQLSAAVITPWEATRRKFFDGEDPEAAVFAQRHNLDEAKVQAVFTGKEISFSPEMCAALRQETGMSEEFFRNLSNQYLIATAA